LRSFVSMEDMVTFDSLLQNRKIPVLGLAQGLYCEPGRDTTARMQPTLV
jgi:hypothetical protein